MLIAYCPNPSYENIFKIRILIKCFNKSIRYLYTLGIKCIQVYLHLQSTLNIIYYSKNDMRDNHNTTIDIVTKI